ncbi:DUF1456 family protein [Desulfoluna butyratoxydans]|uniref:DUF1456 domain-containing protein n=1 Tax=Desulfoluna butyratoxydans TaxID=231438 RepID=A0A4U8YK44_9BACT|nr:DUF1456 family protein [Desulfoluna butyratoxydans]VFQ44041.1 protein of unknown function (duf1456) [Desulfoluna butyratoxydans]
MDNNDILRRIRYAFDFSDPKMAELFVSGGLEVTREQAAAWLKREEDPSFETLSDRKLASFLNGLIIHRRGRREGPQPEAETRLTNNLILKKLKIALNLTSDDVLAIMARANFGMSRHELSAFFRKPGHKHYRECKDQILRNFIQGMQVTYRV